MAYYFNWSHEAVLSLPHWERERWCEQISQINDHINETGEPAPVGGTSQPDPDDVPVLDIDEALDGGEP